MKTAAGLWIDHRRAVVVIVTPDGEENVAEILSNVEKHPGHSGLVVPSHASQQVTADDSRQREFTVHLDQYYSTVAEAVHDAEAILILGPGEAKNEFRKRLEHDKLGAKIAAVETADKMTHHQISAKVREYFEVGARTRAD